MIYNEKLRRVRVTNVAIEEEKTLRILSGCL